MDISAKDDSSIWSFSDKEYEEKDDKMIEERIHTELGLFNKEVPNFGTKINYKKKEQINWKYAFEKKLKNIFCPGLFQKFNPHAPFEEIKLRIKMIEMNKERRNKYLCKSGDFGYNTEKIFQCFRFKLQTRYTVTTSRKKSEKIRQQKSSMNVVAKFKRKNLRTRVEKIEKPMKGLLIPSNSSNPSGTTKVTVKSVQFGNIDSLANAYENHNKEGSTNTKNETTKKSKIILKRVDLNNIKSFKEITRAPVKKKTNNNLVEYSAKNLPNLGRILKGESSSSDSSSIGSNRINSNRTEPENKKASINFFLKSNELSLAERTKFVPHNLYMKEDKPFFLQEINKFNNFLHRHHSLLSGEKKKPQTVNFQECYHFFHFDNYVTDGINNEVIFDDEVKEFKATGDALINKFVNSNLEEDGSNLANYNHL